MWSTELRVAFRAVGEGTELRLVHSGWEGAEDPAASPGGVCGRLARRPVLDRFVRFMGGAGADSPEA